MEKLNRHNKTVPAEAIACLHFASIAGFALSYKSNNLIKQICRAKDALDEARAALSELAESDRLYAPALVAAIENVEEEIAWAESEVGYE